METLAELIEEHRAELAKRDAAATDQAKAIGDQAKVIGDQAKVIGDQAKVIGDQAKVIGDQAEIVAALTVKTEALESCVRRNSWAGARATRTCRRRATAPGAPSVGSHVGDPRRRGTDQSRRS